MTTSDFDVATLRRVATGNLDGLSHKYAFSLETTCKMEGCSNRSKCGVHVDGSIYFVCVCGSCWMQAKTRTGEPMKRQELITRCLKVNSACTPECLVCESSSKYSAKELSHKCSHLLLLYSLKFPGSSHMAKMCYVAVTMFEHGDKDFLDKAQRWLGFIQGVLFTNGDYTLEELKEHMRP